VAKPGQLERYDYESRRNGSVNLFVVSSTFTDLGVRSRSPIGVRPKTTPDACANSSMSIIPMQSTSVSCRINFRPTRQALSIRPSRRPKPDEFCAAWSSITPVGTATQSGCRKAANRAMFLPMGDVLKLIWWAVIGMFRSKVSLEAEILTLRHQLAVLRRKSSKRLAFGKFDRLIFANIYRIAPRILERPGDS
jgi:hypothetical protein